MSQAKETIKLGGGSVLEYLALWVTRELDRSLNSGRFIKVKRWIVHARVARARARGDTDALQESLFHFWRADAADAYFDRYLDRHEALFLGPHLEIVDQLAALSHTGDYRRFPCYLWSLGQSRCSK